MAKNQKLVCLILGMLLVVQAFSFGEAVEMEKEGGDQISPTTAETSSYGENETAEAPEIRRLGKHHSDRSEAGGGVIIGGLVTAIFAALFCYIRVTRKTSVVDDPYL